MNGKGKILSSCATQYTMIERRATRKRTLSSTTGQYWLASAGQYYREEGLVVVLSVCLSVAACVESSPAKNGVCVVEKI